MVGASRRCGGPLYAKASLPWRREKSMHDSREALYATVQKVGREHGASVTAETHGTVEPEHCCEHSASKGSQLGVWMSWFMPTAI